MTTSRPQPDDARERLRQHFLEDRTPSRWDELWKGGSFLPWDRGTSNPALIDTLDTRGSILGPAVKSDGKRKRALVPGCGKGYDVYLLASYGYDAFGLEVGNAVAAAEGLRGEVEGREEYRVRDGNVGRGDVKFVQGDFYKTEWEDETGGGGFDIIYDYTFLCAMPPDLRPKWSQRMVNLLAPGGTLVCLEFPTYKDPKTGGPPWGLKPETYEMLLPFPGQEPSYDEGGYVIKEERPEDPQGLVRVAHWQPARTHKIGEGTDWVGLWKHREAS